MSRFGNDLIRSAKEAVAIAKGEVLPGRSYMPESIDVRALRRTLGLTQAQFAERFGFSLGAVRDWEQARAAPEGATRTFLLVIAREPEAVERALRAA